MLSCSTSQAEHPREALLLAKASDDGNIRLHDVDHGKVRLAAAFKVVETPTACVDRVPAGKREAACQMHMYMQPSGRQA